MADWVTPECGVLVPFADVPALSAALSALIQQRQRLTDMGLAARDYAATEFGPQRLTTRLTEWLSHVKSKSRK